MKNAKEIINLFESVNEDDSEELAKQLEPSISQLKSMNAKYDNLLSKDSLTDSEEKQREDLSKKRHELREKIKQMRDAYHEKHNRAKKRSPASVIKYVHGK